MKSNSNVLNKLICRIASLQMTVISAKWKCLAICVIDKSFTRTCQDTIESARTGKTHSKKTQITSFKLIVYTRRQTRQSPSLTTKSPMGAKILNLVAASKVKVNFKMEPQCLVKILIEMNHLYWYQMRIIQRHLVFLLNLVRILRSHWSVRRLRNLKI